MFIDINTLGPEGLAFDRRLRLRGLEGPARERLPEVEAHVEGTVVPAPRGAALEAKVSATVPLTCSRCLETFPLELGTDFSGRVLRQAAAADATSQSPDVDDEASVLIAPEGKIGLEELATEQIYLSLPLKPVCSETCKGLCPTCGSNRNLVSCGCATETPDPRLAPLLAFRSKTRNS